MKELFKYHYIYYKDSSFCQYFSKPQPIYEEGSILRLAELHIISKNDIVSVEEKFDAGNNIYAYYSQKCSGRMLITLTSGEVMELGIAKVE
ncbi:hypothetical protein [uncultured Eubacterium sp.]|uniref:hypothetical protein n=1 Tax=uncultured Eubacterium sp. TaxID=165185 RepID=UPI0025D92CE2|nr:hypothetical protein [uncultured Eubacterium sp.]